ncbi:MAG: nodulation protein NfeD [Chloroflexi bacterium]|nr:MAG: nodulation protein NfeD [Chloroflexota bacterium]
MTRAARLFLAATMLAVLLPAVQARAAEPHVLVATLNGVINPITDNYVSTAVDRAVSGQANALIIAMDTPGGLDTSMRDIIKKILAAPLPVVIFVSPSGARAASAGLYITEAADIAVMAPGTNIGSAHPVSLGGSNPAASPAASPGASGATSTAPDIESQKIENDAAAYIRALATLHNRNADWAEKAVRQSINAPADDAVKLGVVDFESRDLDMLLQELDGRQVSKGGHTYTLQTAKIGIGFWVTHPGMFLPGVIGVIAGVLAAVSLYDLPINIAGVLLILIAVVLFVIDLKAVTHGVLTTGGIVAMTLGGLLLVNTSFLAEGVNIPLLIVTVLVIAGVFLFILRKLIDARRRPYAAGEESMIGSLGSVREPLDPSGMVFVNGALWQATSTGGALETGAQVRVVGVDGLRLRVEPVQQPQAGRSEGPQAASS